MGYVDVFGGGVVNPADLSYSSIALTANITLQWATDYPASPTPFTRIIDVTPSGAGYTITLPDASAASTGIDTLVRNFGPASFTVDDNSGAAQVTVLAGQAVYIYLTNNSTSAGTWKVLLFGAGSSALSAGSVASPTVIAQANTLNVAFPVTSVGTSFTALATHRGNTFAWTGGSGTATLTSAATLGSDWFAFFHNSGSGALTLSPSGGQLIDGNASFSINPTESLMLVSSGSAFYTVGYGRSSAFVYTALAKNVAGSTDVTLSLSEAANVVQNYTGILTGNINVIVPAVVAVYYVYNSTTGAFTLTVKTPSGAGTLVTQTSRYVLVCDGTNVYAAQSAGVGSVTSILTGAGLTGGPITGSGAIDIATSPVTAGSYNLSGYTIDSYGRTTAVNEISAHLAPYWGQ